MSLYSLVGLVCRLTFAGLFAGMGFALFHFWGVQFFNEESFLGFTLFKCLGAICGLVVGWLVACALVFLLVRMMQKLLKRN